VISEDEDTAGYNITINREPEVTANLLTDTYYVISLKSKPGSLLSFDNSTSTSTLGSRFLQLITKGAENYTPGQDSYQRILWRLRPTEIQGYYTLENKDVLTGLTTATTYTDKLGFFGNYLSVNTDSQDLKTLVAGAPLRDRVLWSVETSEVKGYFVLRLRAFPNGAITWKSKTTQEGFYLQVSLIFDIFVSNLIKLS
jgi:hypothetical protein